MLSEDSGRIIRHVDTPGGGYRIVETSKRGSNLVKVSYFDKNGIERKEMMEWQRYPTWRRALDWVVRLFKMFAGRL